MRSWLLVGFVFCIACSATKFGQEEAVKMALLQTENVQLSNPRINVDSILFRTSAQVSLAFELPETALYYKLDDVKPKNYDHPFVINQTTSIQVQARKEDFLPSDWVEQTFIKTNDKTTNARIELLPNAHENYPSTGASALINLQKGSLDFRSNTAWSGFQTEQVVIKLDFEKEIDIANIYCSLLSDHNSWIFLPKRIQVWQQNELLGTTKLIYPAAAEKPALKMISVAIAPKKYKTLELRILNHTQIPDWHVGKGSAPWLFLDEVFID